MGRPQDTARRAELLAGATDYVLEHGLGELSLRPLAEELGTSARMLVHHFGSKDRLIADTLAEARQRQLALLGEFLSASPDSPPEAILDVMWGFMSSPEAEPFMRLFFEVYGLALWDPDRFPDFLERAVMDWIDAIRDLLRASGQSEKDARAGATEGLAVLRGLLLDLLATGDRDRIDIAYQNASASLLSRAEKSRARRPKAE
ncbi:MAG: TetR/AcrR family transcriptional regulator [Chloroflexi bacterium]|nr:MAG: TetR/AcrR family transcriptional regulator [Chloroflexota bacterium]